MPDTDDAQIIASPSQGVEVEEKVGWRASNGIVQ
jgi:hypothetical protein